MVVGILLGRSPSPAEVISWGQQRTLERWDMSHWHRSQDLCVSELWGLLPLNLGISPNSLGSQKTHRSSVPLVNRGFISSRNLRAEYADSLSWGLKIPRGSARDRIEDSGDHLPRRKWGHLDKADEFPGGRDHGLLTTFDLCLLPS